MNFLKKLWRKLFGYKTGAYDSTLFERFYYGTEEFYEDLKRQELNNQQWKTFWERWNKELPKLESYEEWTRKAYDPSLDEHKIMSGEVESYFD